MQADKNIDFDGGKENDEIKLLLKLLGLVWKEGRLLFLTFTVFIIVGLLVALLSTEMYQVESRVLPEASDGRGASSTLLNQLGVGMPFRVHEGRDAISPSLYPDVLNSSPFFIELLEQRIKFEVDGNVVETDMFNYVNEYMQGNVVIGVLKKYTYRLPWTIISLLRSSNAEINSDAGLNIDIQFISRQQYLAVKKLRGCISADISQRTGIITVYSEFPDPLVAAQVASFAVDYLGDYITDYRIKKALRDFEFIKDRHKENESEFYKAQINLANFRDANRNVVSAAARTEEQRLQDHYNLAFDIYKNLSQQLEQARIKIQEETPVIKILEPVQIPFERSSPRRGLIVIISIFLGLFAGLILIFLKHLRKVYIANYYHS